MRRFSDESSPATTVVGSGGSGQSDAETQASKADADGALVNGANDGIVIQKDALERQSAAADSVSKAPDAGVLGIPSKRASGIVSSKPDAMCDLTPAGLDGDWQNVWKRGVRSKHVQRDEIPVTLRDGGKSHHLGRIQSLELKILMANSPEEEMTYIKMLQELKSELNAS